MGHIYDINGSIIDETDKTLSIENVPADAKSTGEALKNIIPHIEPEPDDIPSLYITGRELPVSKDEGKIKYAVEYVSNTLSFSEYCTLKPQGDSSLTFPKKNYNLVFYKANDFKKKSKHEFKNWGSQSKYTIKANWADPTHARNIVTARIWADMVRQRSNYDTLPTAMLESPNLCVVDGFPIKVFWDGVYLGRYTMNIPKDAWMWNMDDEVAENAVLYSEGRATDNPATNFRQTVNIDGRDWSDEVHEDSVPQSIIDSFNAFVSFVMNSSDSDFVSGLEQYVDVGSVIDAIILAWADTGVDSLHKNQIFMTYDGEKYIASVYDLDSTWGSRWDGIITYSYDYPITSQSFTQNNLYDRVKALFSERLKRRFAELRAGALSESNISKRFNEFSEIMSRELIEQDWAETTGNGKYTEIPSKDESTVPIILNYMAKRLEYLDHEMSEEYPKITVEFDPGDELILTQDGIDVTKEYLTVTFYENENDTGTEIQKDEYTLRGEVKEGDVPITVRYNGYAGYFTASFSDFYNQYEWAFPGKYTKLVKGNNSRANIWGHSQLTINTSSGIYNAAMTRGVRPFRDHQTFEDLDAFPIPVPDGANKITVHVTPADLQIKMSLWEDYSGAGRYSRSQDPGILGTGTAVWSDIQRSQDYHEFLCLEFRKASGAVSQGEITAYDITFEAEEDM